MPAILQLDLAQIISQALSFIILLAILRKFAWGPLLAVLDRRRTSIEEQFRQLAQRKDELDRLQADYTQRLAKIEDEARTKIQQAIVEGKRVASEIQEEARNQSQAVMVKARETVELEIAKARETLKEQVAQMTVQAVERILRQKLDAKTDERLVASVLDELEREPARS